MRRLLPALAAVCLTACAHHSPVETVVDHKATPVQPPAALTHVCESIPSDGSIAQELKRLSDLVLCERGDKGALQAFFHKLLDPA